jgi:hypothetical protein
MNLVPIHTPLAALSLLIKYRAAEEAYFGRTDSPNRQKPIAVLRVKLGAPDPTRSGELIEPGVVYALFNRHTTVHPSTGEAPNRARRFGDVPRHGAAVQARVTAMPIFSLYFDTREPLDRSEVHWPHLSHSGLPGFKSAWIDTHRRTS